MARPHPSDPPRDPERRHGTIVRRIVDRAFGFIRDPASGEEFFFHASALENCEFGNLQDGEAVSFAPKTTPKGLRAEEVRRV